MDDDDFKGILSLFFLIVVAVFMISGVVNSYRFAHTETELTARILDTETKMVDKEDHWFVNVQPVQKIDGEYEAVGNPEVLEVADSAVYGQRNSSDVYFLMKNKIGAVYHFKLQGWRDAYWSKWRNIVGYELLQDKGR